MAKGSPGQGYAPLSWLNRGRLNRAATHLRSHFPAVRKAAHDEIARILSRSQKSRLGRLKPRELGRRAWERFNYGKLQKCRVVGCDHKTRHQKEVAKHLQKHQREVLGDKARGGFGQPRTEQQRRAEQQRAHEAPRPQERQQDGRTRQSQSGASVDAARAASRHPDQDGPSRAPAATDLHPEPRAARPPRTNQKPAAARVPLDVVAKPDAAPRAPAPPKPAAPVAAPRAPRLPSETVRIPTRIR
jgi:hypothetical protein